MLPDRVKNRAHAIALRLLTAASCAICLSANAAAMQDAVNQVPTPVEQALIEHQCGATRATRPGGNRRLPDLPDLATARDSNRLGRDLSKLTPVERRSLDSVCNKVRNFEGATLRGLLEQPADGPAGPSQSRQSRGRRGGARSAAPPAGLTSALRPLAAAIRIRSGGRSRLWPFSPFSLRPEERRSS